MKTILVVDDEADIRDMMESHLTEIGYEVVTAADGKEALRKVQITKPDLILLDISLPVMDGSEVVLQLKKKEQTKNIPIIFMTAMGTTQDQFEGMRMIGGFPTFSKPFDTEELIGTIREVLSNSNPSV